MHKAATAMPELSKSPLEQEMFEAENVLIEGLVDTHHHMLPAFFVEAMGEKALAAVNPGAGIPNWTPQADLAVMDEFGIRIAVLSTPVGPSPTPEANASLARRLNEYGADLVRDHPKRYAMFGHVPLPDIDASLREAAFAFDTLGVPGLIVMTNYNGKYLGDLAFAPFWEEMNRRKAVIFVHPTNPVAHVMDISPGILEFVFDTTRTITSLIYAGVTTTYPDIKFIFSHGGGTFPYIWSRIDGPTRMDSELHSKLPNGVRAEIQKLYWDTALCFDPTQLASLLSLVDPSKVMFGTDFPFAPKTYIPASLESLGAQLGAERARQIFTNSAHALMPTLAH